MIPSGQYNTMTTTTIGDHYECQHCHRTFVREKTFLKHRCKMMERIEEMETPTGQSAWLLYSTWLRTQRRMVPKTITFLTSQYYSAFVRFAGFVQGVRITEPDIFIQLMVNGNIPPSMWCCDKSYAMYLEHISRAITPIQQISISIKVLMKLADAMECDISTVLFNLTIGELLQLIRERKLTPWLLLHSKSFKQVLHNLTPEQRGLIEELIRPAYWKFLFQRDPQLVQKIKDYVAQLNI